MNEDESLEATIRVDPSELDRRIETVRSRLRSENPHDGVDAGRAFRVVAEENPERLEAHLDTMVDLLSDENGSLRLSGAIGLAGAAKTDPATVDEVVPELVVLLERACAPSIQIAALRALSRVGERSSESVAVADSAVADLLGTATPQIRLAVVTIFASVVIDAPSKFPETVRATEGALDDDSGRVRRCAAATLARVAIADPTTLSSVAGVLNRVEALEARLNAQPWHHDETVEEAADTLRALVEAREPN